MRSMPIAVRQHVMGYLLRSRKSWCKCRTLSKSYQLAAQAALQEYLDRSFKAKDEGKKTSRDVHAVERWIRILGATSSTCDSNTAQCLLKGLDDWRLWIQVACLAALPKVVGQCDAVAETTLMQYITRTDSQVDRAGRPKVQFVGSTTSSEDCKFEAFKSLAKVANPDSESVVSFMLDNILFTYTEDNGAEYWQEPQHMPAVDCLVQLGKVGGAGVIESLLVQLGTDRMHVDRRVLRALGKLTNSGNANVINALLRLMPGFHCTEGIDYHGKVVDEAYATLKHIVEPCDKHAICEVVGIIADPNMWQDAFKAVERATHEGHVQGIRWDFWNDSSEDERNCDGCTKLTESQVESSSSGSDSTSSTPPATASSQLVAAKTPPVRQRSMKAGCKASANRRTSVYQGPGKVQKVLKRPASRVRRNGE
mmetsp:Transcript_90035/g.160300  ORF Transcript_90035/g.160300 Transcript_90035/m.160300 type:complete len:423 (+) Transcript_90035:67-1335(+)